LDHQGKDPPDPSRRNPRVTPELSAIVMRMMASDPRRRYASPEDLLRDLMPVAAAFGLRGVPADGVIWASVKPQGTRFWERNIAWIATVALLLAIVAVLDRFPGLGPQPHAKTGSVAPRVEPPKSPAAAPEPQKTGGEIVPPLDDEFLPPDKLPADPGESAAGGNLASSSDERFQPTAGTPRQEIASPHVGGQETSRARSEADDEFSNMLVEEILGSTAKELQPIAPRTPILPEAATRDRSASSSPRRPRSDNLNADPPSRYQGQAFSSDSIRQELVPSPFSVSPPARRDEPAIAIYGSGDDFVTLEAACSAAQDGQIVELRYNGRRAGPPERPFRLKNKRLTIRAGKDLDGNTFRPVLEFDAGRSDTRMITLIGGSLELLNLDIRVGARDDMATDQWALLWLQGAERVEMKGVDVTFINPHDAPSAVFELKSGPGRILDNMDKLNRPNGLAAADSEFRIRMVDSFVRGPCDLFIARHTSPGRFVVENSALAIDGSLLNVIGDLNTPRENADFELQLDHVTAIVGNGLLRMDSGLESRSLLPVQVTAQNNIFASKNSSPLVSMMGSSMQDDLRSRLRWNGTNNFYEQFATFWSITPSIPAAILEELGFEEWKARWGADTEVDPKLNELVWRYPWRSEAKMAQLTPGQLMLDETARPNSQAWFATDAGNVGADLSRLSSPVGPAE
jgi:serine/threonine-protein kinase